MPISETYKAKLVARVITLIAIIITRESVLTNNVIFLCIHLEFRILGILGFLVQLRGEQNRHPSKPSRPKSVTNICSAERH